MKLWIARVVLLLCTVVFFATTFRWGWTRVETDFPNYYTAASLFLQGEPQRLDYDWTWFQRHMNYVGVERQLGGYVPHTPITLLPMVPLAKLPPQNAKQVWLAMNLLFLAGSIVLLAKVASIRPESVALLVFLGYGSLQGNFVLGQYYVLILFLFCLSVWLLNAERDFAAGLILGSIFAVKLYSAPFLLYFVVKRQWRAAAGMMAAIAGWSLVSLAMFGWQDNWFFVTNILPCALNGTFNDPYNSGLGSLTALLRRTFIAEPDLNPNPPFEYPAAFFLLRTLITLAFIVFSLLAVRHNSRQDWRREFAWFVILAFVVSPVVVSYQYVMILVAVVLLLRRGSLIDNAPLVILIALASAPVGPRASWLFPKVWLLLIAYFGVGWSLLRRIPVRQAAYAAALVIAAAAFIAPVQLSGFHNESARTLKPAKIEPGAVFSSRPVWSPDGLWYQSIGEERYLLRRVRPDGSIETHAFEGHALHPAASASGAIFFELVAHGHSAIWRYQGSAERVTDPGLDAIEPSVSPDGKSLAFVAGRSLYLQTGASRTILVSAAGIANPAFFPNGNEIAYSSGPLGSSRIFAIAITGGTARLLTDGSQPAISPDGNWLAFTATEAGHRQVWVQELATGSRRAITTGACNSDEPAWNPDSKRIVFASDCGRGYGLPTLYETER